jgi:uncharacterized protein YndB with AHSA1/START domain
MREIIMTHSHWIRREIGTSVIAVFATALAIGSPAKAGEPKSVISITTKAIELTVMIDDALKRYPGLYNNLLAEGRHASSKWGAQAQTERSGDQFSIREGRTWTYTLSYRLRSEVAQHLVSIIREEGTYEGGAHPISNINTILWDTYSRKRTSMRPFFVEAVDNGPTMTVLATSIQAALAAEKKARGAEVAEHWEKDTWLAAVKPRILNLGAVTLAPSTVSGKSSGLTFHFSPYGVGSYAEGSYTAFVPWTDFKAFLSPAGQAIFAGERPPGDADVD